jgi:hypothetical protein
MKMFAGSERRESKRDFCVPDVFAKNLWDCG